LPRIAVAIDCLIDSIRGHVGAEISLSQRRQISERKHYKLMMAKFVIPGKEWRPAPMEPT
jgi:hypothetical protein